jgi:hypothetical protein
MLKLNTKNANRAFVEGKLSQDDERDAEAKAQL